VLIGLPDTIVTFGEREEQLQPIIAKAQAEPDESGEG
jgi:hypothetical protein